MACDDIGLRANVLAELLELARERDRHFGGAVLVPPPVSVGADDVTRAGGVEDSKAHGWDLFASIVGGKDQPDSAEREATTPLVGNGYVPEIEGFRDGNGLDGDLIQGKADARRVPPPLHLEEFLDHAVEPFGA